MAGQPMQRAATKLMQTREDEIWDRLAKGETVLSLCEDLDISPSTFYRAIKKVDGFQQRFDEAREMASHALADETISIADEARKEKGITAAEAAIVREQNNSRRWLATKIGRAIYGEAEKSADVIVNIRQLHLEALRHVGERGIPAGRMSLPEERPDRDASVADKHLQIMEAEDIDVEVMDDE